MEPSQAVEGPQQKSVTFQATQTECAVLVAADAVSKGSIPIMVATLSPEKEAAAAAVSCKQTCSTKHQQRSRRKPRPCSDDSDSSSNCSSSSKSDNEPAVQAKRSSMRTWKYPGLQSTSSYRRLTTVGGCHQYTISGYALSRSLGPGTRLCSDMFDAGGQQFRLEVYPSGISADTSHHLSLFLTTPGSGNPNHVLHEIAVVDQSGRGRHLLRCSKPKAQAPTMAPISGVVAGYPHFVRAALLEKHHKRYLVNDSLIIRATVEVVRSWSTAPQQISQPGSMSPGQLSPGQLSPGQLPPAHAFMGSLPLEGQGVHCHSSHFGRARPVSPLYAPAAAVGVQTCAYSPSKAAAAAAAAVDQQVHCQQHAAEQWCIKSAVHPAAVAAWSLQGRPQVTNLHLGCPGPAAYPHLDVHPGQQQQQQQQQHLGCPGPAAYPYKGTVYCSCWACNSIGPGRQAVGLPTAAVPSPATTATAEPTPVGEHSCCCCCASHASMPSRSTMCDMWPTCHDANAAAAQRSAVSRSDRPSAVGEEEEAAVLRHANLIAGACSCAGCFATGRTNSCQDPQSRTTNTGSDAGGILAVAKATVTAADADADARPAAAAEGVGSALEGKQHEHVLQQSRSSKRSSSMHARGAATGFPGVTATEAANALNSAPVAAFVPATNSATISAGNQQQAAGVTMQQPGNCSPVEVCYDSSCCYCQALSAAPGSPIRRELNQSLQQLQLQQGINQNGAWLPGWAPVAVAAAARACGCATCISQARAVQVLAFEQEQQMMQQRCWQQQQKLGSCQQQQQQQQLVCYSPSAPQASLLPHHHCHSANAYTTNSSGMMAPGDGVNVNGSFADVQPAQPQAATSCGTVGVAAHGHEPQAGLAVPVARHHPVRVLYYS